MKVVLAVCNTGRYLGINKYFYLLAKHLILNGVEVELIVDSEEGIRHFCEVFRDKEADANYAPLKNLNFKIISPTAGGLLNVPATAAWCWNLSQYLQLKEFDILHTPHINPIFYLMRKNHKPVVFQPFGNELFSLEETATGYKKLYYKAFQPVLRYCGHNCDALAVEGMFQWDEMVKWYSNRKAMFILPVGIDVDYVTSTVEDARSSIKRLPNQILAVNSLYSYEGMDILINAVRILSLKIPDLQLVLIGSGPEEKRIHALIDQYNLRPNVRHFTEVPERSLYRYYAQSSVFVSTSMEKDFLMPILEAEALGCPVVSTGQEWLIDGNGYVVDRKPWQIAESVRKVLEGDVEAMGKRSWEIVQQYDFKEIAKTAIKKYEELTDSGKRRSKVS